MLKSSLFAQNPFFSPDKNILSLLPPHATFWIKFMRSNFKIQNLLSGKAGLIGPQGPPGPRGPQGKTKMTTFFPIYRQLMNIIVKVLSAQRVFSFKIQKSIVIHLTAIFSYINNMESMCALLLPYCTKNKAVGISCIKWKNSIIHSQTFFKLSVR